MAENELHISSGSSLSLFPSPLQMIIYHVLSCLLSFVGLNLNIFYFSIHLLDLIMHFKRLRTVLYSVLHNRRQLAMTALLMFMVIYLYTVLAFNFFREFYRQSTPEGSQVYNCDSMFKVRR